MESEMDGEMMDYMEDEEIRHVVVFVTAPDLEGGKKIARALVEEEIAACVNVIEGITSIFMWKSKIEEEKECLLVIKTRLVRVGDVIDVVKSMHGYDVPEIIALPVVDGNPAYLKWIDEVT